MAVLRSFLGDLSPLSIINAVVRFLDGGVLNKEEWRVVCRPLPKERIITLQGRLAENLRRLRDYKHCKRIYLDPSLLLRQARVNSLLDGKELVMPTAGLKEGFYLLKPFRIPFKKLVMAVTYKGVAQYAESLDPETISSLDVSLLVGEAFAVDRQGGRVGDGQGFFDLACAILWEMGGLAGNFQTVAAIDDQAKIVEKIPQDFWDVRCDKILSPDGISDLGDFSGGLKIFWDSLPAERIKRISPLWKLSRQQ